MLNQSGEYALRVTVRLAHLEPDAWAQVADLAAELELPANYLSKLMHQLAAAEILQSRRGRNGGFRLMRPAEQLTVGDVVAPFSPPRRERECFLGGHQCSAETACEVHETWKPIADRIHAFMTETTVAHMVGRDVPNPRGGLRAPRAPVPRARKVRS